MKTRIIASVIIALIFTFSCQRHRPVSVTLPEQKSFSKSGGQYVKRWWESFHDPGLNRAVEEAFSQNLRLKQAWARLRQAGAVAKITAAPGFPQLSANAELGRSRTNQRVLSETHPLYTNRYLLNAPLSYEIDLWGRLSSATRGARLDVRASQCDLEAMAMSISGEVSETWFSIIAEKARLNLIRKQLKVNETYLDLIRARFGQGLASALDVYQQQQQLAATRALTPPVKSRLTTFNHKLAILLGKGPLAKRETGSSLGDLPDFPAIEPPGELVKTRPDVKAAYFRMEAANARVAAAIAHRFPSVRLGASGGFRAANISNLFENLVWDILGNISQSVWDGGGKSSEVKRTEAVLEERVAAYVEAALVAFGEVEDAIVREEHQFLYLGKLDKQMAYAKLALEEAKARYMSGLDNYLPVLVALQSVQSLEQTIITGRKELISHRIQLCKALGGGWREFNNTESD